MDLRSWMIEEDISITELAKAIDEPRNVILGVLFKHFIPDFMLAEKISQWSINKVTVEELIFFP